MAADPQLCRPGTSSSGFRSPGTRARGGAACFTLTAAPSAHTRSWELNPDTEAVIDSDVVDATTPAPIAGLGISRQGCIWRNMTPTRFWSGIRSLTLRFTTLNVSADLMVG